MGRKIKSDSLVKQGNAHTIYCAKNKINGKIYIGFDSNWPSRMKEHLRQLVRNENHSKFSKTKFHNALRKYGEENFEWSVLETYITQNENDWYCLDVLERKYIEKYDSYKSGYNLTLGGDGSRGFRPTQEQKDKQKEFIKINGHPMQGIPRSAETKKKISEANKGRIPTDIEKIKCQQNQKIIGILLLSKNARKKLKMLI